MQTRNMFLKDNKPDTAYQQIFAFFAETKMGSLNKLMAPTWVE